MTAQPVSGDLELISKSPLIVPLFKRRGFLPGVVVEGAVVVDLVVGGGAAVVEAVVDGDDGLMVVVDVVVDAVVEIGATVVLSFLGGSGGKLTSLESTGS